MKKLLLPISVLLLSSGAFGQFYTDNFDDNDISDWSLTDADGDGNDWEVQTNNSGDALGKVISASYDNTDGALTPDNYMVSPSFSLVGATGTTIVKWTVTAQDQSYAAEKYSVYAHTSNAVIDLSGSAQSFTETLGTGVFERTLDISALNGETAVYIAFRHYDCTDEFQIVLDDVSVETLPPFDIEMTSVLASQVSLPGTIDITGTVTNVGADPITSFDIDWNDGTAHNETFTQNIAPGASYNFTHSTQYTSVAGTTSTIDVCASLTGDATANNDCKSTVITGASQAGTRLALLELFTSSTCPPYYGLNYSLYGGGGLNAGLDNLNANDQENAEIAVIKYQVNWPGSGDHAYNADANPRISYYGVTGAPTPIVNATEYGFSTYNAANTTTHQNEAAYCDIAATHSSDAGVITVNVDVTPYASWTGANYIL
jgi:hypothetical protein